MNQLFYVYGLLGNEKSIASILMKHNLSFNTLETLHSEGFEYEIPITLPNPEFNTAVAEINNVASCWIQPTRKGAFLKPANMFSKLYNATSTCRPCEHTKKIVYSCTLSCTYGILTGVKISSYDNCSSAKHLYTEGSYACTSSYEMIDLNTVYYKRFHDGTHSLLFIEGMII